MANTIIIKQSSTATDIPTAGQMTTGELAVNVTDMKLYSKDATTVFELGTKWDGFLIEKATADGDSTGEGQLWVRDDAPNTLWFTGDTGIDRPIGYNGMPPLAISASQNMLLAQVGYMLHKSSGVAITLTCAQDTDTWDGATWAFHNDDTEDVTIAAGASVTVYYVEAGAAPVAGSVVIKQGGIVSIYKRSNTEFWVWGAKDGVTGSGVSALDDLSDVTLTSPADDSILIYDTGTARWRDYTMSGDLDLNDVGVTTLQASAITGKTALTSGLLSTDEMLISDAGLLKRMDISVLQTYMQANLSGFGTVNGTGTNNYVAVWNGTDDIDAVGSLNIANVVDKTGTETITGAWEWQDSASIRFGNSADAIMYYDGVDDFRIDLLDTNNFRVRGGTSGTEAMFHALANGEFGAYYNGSLKFTTTNVGVNITGNIALTGTIDGVDMANVLQTTTNFGGDVSGVYNAIVVANDSHTHTFDNLTSKASGTGNYTTTGIFTAADFRATGYGAAASPNWSSTSSTGTGMYVESSNVLAFSSASVRRLQLYATVALFAPYVQAPHFEANTLGPNSTPGTDDAYLGGYGILGSRGTFYVSNVAGAIALNHTGVHGTNTKLVTAADGIDVTGDVGATTIAGIASAQLVAKNATETISGVWTFTGAKTTMNQLFINETSGSDADTAGDGQIWVKNNVPNDLYYTADNGIDYPIAYATYRRQSQTVLDHLNQTLNMTTDTVADAMVNGLWAKTTTTARTLTLEPSTDTQFQVGAQLAIYNRAASGTMTVTEGSGTTLYVLDGATVTDAAGSATIAAGGYATLIRESTTVYVLMGAGITP